MFNTKTNKLNAKYKALTAVRIIKRIDMLNDTLKISTKHQIEMMFMKHYKEWCLLSYSYLENISEAEDMVQDVFVKILNRKVKTEILDLKSYISTAVRNTSLKKIQRSKKLETINEYCLADLEPSHEEFMINIEKANRLKASLNILPQQTRKVFELCVLEGAKYQGAADILGISINTVKFHLKKSYKILRSNLQNAYS